MDSKTLDLKSLQIELEQFRKEKDDIRKLVGQIGGSNIAKRDRVFNFVFITALSSLFIMDIIRHLFHIDVPIPTELSLEIGVLMVSIKIIWMMHKQAKVEHFQFWILNSIEFRLNDISKKIRNQNIKIESIRTVIEGNNN